MNTNILFLVTEDWYFLSHRLALAQKCKAIGYNVYVACNDTGKIKEITSYGFKCYNLNIKRGSFSFFSFLKSINEVSKVLKKTNTYLLHAVSMQSIIISILYIIFNKNIKLVAAVTGLGTLFLANSLKDRIIKLFITLILIVGFGRKNTRVIVQNKDDQKFVKRNCFCNINKIILIRGSGVDIHFHQKINEPDYPPITIAYVGRLIKDKGVENIIEAFKLAYKENNKIKLLLVGSLDTKNKRPLSKNYIEESIRENINIEHLGEIEDVRIVWKRAHIAILASKREGLPKSLLEAAAAGRAIISTDVPGSREIALKSLNAEVVCLGNNKALAKAILYLSENHKIRKMYGIKSRELVESDMSEENVIKKILNLYKSF